VLLLIPDLPEGISDDALLTFYDTLSGNLSDQGTIHINWFTHRRNPSVCWICDQQILITKLLELCGTFITKSTVDLETELMSEDETDTEIDSESMNIDEEIPYAPEYDTEEHTENT